MRSFAVVQWSRLGDLLQTRPLLRALRRSDPAARIVLYADERYADVVRWLPEQPDFVPVNLASLTGAARHASSHVDFLRNAANLFHACAIPEFNDVYVLTRSNAAAIFAEMLKPNAIYGYRSEAGCLAEPEQIAWVEQRMTAGLPACVHLADLWTTLAHSEPLCEWLQPLSRDGIAERKEHAQPVRLSILCDAGEAYRSFPQEWFETLVARISETDDIQIALLGQNASTFENPFPSLHPQRNRIVDYRGRTNLSEFCEQLVQSDLVVGPDTGGLHLAAALGISVIGLYFGGADALHTGPYAEQAYVIQNPSWAPIEIADIAALIVSVIGRSIPVHAADGANVLTPVWDKYGLVYQPRFASPLAADVTEARREFFERFAIASTAAQELTADNCRLSDVAVIIPENGAEYYTDELLPDLTNELGADAEIVLVAGDSSAARSSMSLPHHVHCIREPKTLTFAEACNRGARETNRKWLLFLNNDTRVPPGTIRTLLRHADKQSLRSPLIRYPDGLLQNEGVALRNDCVVEIAHGTMNAGQTVEPDALSAVALLMSRHAFNELQGFDEAYCNGYEDLDLCLRARERGYRLSVEPNAAVVHYRGGTPGRYDQDEANRRRFVQRWRSQLRNVNEVSTARSQFNHETPLTIVSDEPAETAGSCLRWIWPLERIGFIKGRDYEWMHVQPTRTRLPDIKHQLKKAQAVVVFRPLQSEETQQTMLATVAETHAKLLVDADDLFLGRFAGNSVRADAWRMMEANYSDLLKAADEITVSTEELKAQLQSRGYEAVVVETIPSHHQMPETAANARDSGRFCIGFFGTPSHLIDLGSILPALEAIVEKYSHVWFYWWGCRPGEFAYHPRVRQGGPSVIDYSAHLRRLHEFRLDAAVVPLLDSPFTRAKSPVKFFEYALASVPAVFSNVLPYRDIIKDGQTGILAADSTWSWMQSLENLILDKQLHSSIQNEAHKQVSAIFADTTREERFRTLVAELLQRTHSSMLASRNKTYAQ
jgi:GT2 family glycosyltransferase/ADP-heptose:LPS heptosyltransferase